MTRFELKIVVILLATAAFPLLVSALLVRLVIRDSLAVGLNREVRGQLDETLVLYGEYFRTLRRTYQLAGESIASGPDLTEAVRQGDFEGARSVLEREIEARPELRSLAVRSADRAHRVRVERTGGPDPAEVRSLVIERPLSLGADPAILEATFEAPIAPFERFQRAGEFVRTYGQLEDAGDQIRRYYTLVFVGILAIVIVASTLAGIWIARRTSRRLVALTRATRLVAAGNLAVELPVGGRDEVAELTGAFNAMVRELRENRERIEYLQKISAWQEMARRLAHEIKNPLTPIQLAIQQLREKAPREDAAFSVLLDRSAALIEEEVGALRQLTEEFSTFAKLPEVRTEPADLNEFVAECLQGARLIGEGASTQVAVLWEPAADPLPVDVDRLLFKRVVDNLVINAIESVSASRRDDGRVIVRTQSDVATGHALLRVIDNGPGVPADLGSAIFDPYVTTKESGTGLGLAIVKKVTLEHGGVVGARAATDSSAPGAEFVVWLPLRPQR